MAVLLGLLITGVSPALAVVIAGGDGTGNTTMPPYPSDNGFPGTDPGWWGSIVLAPETGVYLGNGWVLTAYHSVQSHVQDGTQFSVTIGGNPYTSVVGSYQRLANPAYQSGDPAYNQWSDLELYQLNKIPPGLPNLYTSISQTAPLNNWIVAAGAGPSGRSATDLWFDTSGNVVPAGSSTAVYNGFSYNYDQGTPLRWGESQVTATAPNTNDGSGITQMFSAPFGPNTFQAAPGDSGGPAFSYNTATSQWELSGLLLANDVPDALSNSHEANYGSNCYMADLSQYRTEITNIVPEPSSVALLAAGGVGLLGYRLLRARRR
ncbi:MAG: trypsin-like serine protease [Thermoguttaceae bacterium]